MPPRDERHSRYLHPDAFQTVWNGLAPSNIDLTASTASAQRPSESPGVASFSRYESAGSSGVEIDVLAQDVARAPGTGEPAAGCCSLAPIMAGHIAHYLAECQAHAVIVALDTRAYWFPLAQRAVH